MNKRLFSLLLAFLLLLGLAACRPAEEELLVPSDPPPAEDPEEPPETMMPVPLLPEEPVPEAPVSQADWIIDTAFLTERSQTIEQIWPAGDDLLLVFTSTLSGGYVSEQISLYPYSLRDRAFTGDWIALGIVGQYPHEVFDDGTVMVLTRNTETYEYENMLFIDPNSLTMETCSLGGIDDLRSVHVSPDKRMAALSTQQGLRITDLSFETILATYPGFVPEGGDPDLDYTLPTATGWMDDGSGVVGKLMGWEYVCHPFILYPDGHTTVLNGYEGQTALPFGDRLLLCDSFSHLPLYQCAADGSDRQSPTSGLSFSEDGSSYISALRCDGQNRLLGLAVATPDGAQACTAYIYQNGALLHSLTLPQNGAFPVSFDSIAFTPDGAKALLMTGATVDYPCAVHIVSLR